MAIMRDDDNFQKALSPEKTGKSIQSTRKEPVASLCVFSRVETDGVMASLTQLDMF